MTQKNSLTVEYKEWTDAADNFVDICEKYHLDSIYFADTPADAINSLNLKNSLWQFYIIREIDKRGLKAILITKSPSNRILTLAAQTGIPSFSLLDFLETALKNAETGILGIEQKFDFLGETLPHYERTRENFVLAQEYTSKREAYDWYASLDQIITNTDEENPATVRVKINLGYKKDDKTALTEITNRRGEITDALRRFFSEQTATDLKPQYEELLRQNIKDLLNDTILSDSRIRDVRFTQLDVTQQY